MNVSLQSRQSLLSRLPLSRRQLTIVGIMTKELSYNSNILQGVCAGTVCCLSHRGPDTKALQNSVHRMARCPLGLKLEDQTKNNSGCLLQLEPGSYVHLSNSMRAMIGNPRQDGMFLFDPSGREGGGVGLHQPARLYAGSAGQSIYLPSTDRCAPISVPSEVERGVLVQYTHTSCNGY